MRVLAVDFGTRRLGLAVGENNTLMSAKVLAIKGPDEVPRVIANLVRNESVQTVVFGLPLRMDGTERTEAQRVRAVAIQVSKETNVPVVFVDERLTTEEAKQLLRERGMKEVEMRHWLDQTVAEILLSQYYNQQT